MNNTRLTTWARTELAAMHPNYQNIVVRVLDILAQDSDLRDSSKFRLKLPEQENEVWGFTMAGVWVAYIEEDDGGLSVIHLTMLSRFRYDYGY